MMKYLIPMLTALVIIGSAVVLAAWYLGSSPNRLYYDIYIDENNRIYVNGDRATEETVYRLGRDMTVDIHIKKHENATTVFCFQERGCIEN